MIIISPISVATLDHVFEDIGKGASLPNSSWKGEASAYFRLESPVKQEPLVALFKGSTPDGKVSLFSGGLGEAVPDGWLIQFIPPPTVRNLWAMAPDRDRVQIETCHQRAANYCLYSLERALRGPEDGRMETLIPGVAMAVVPSNPLKQMVPQLQTEAFLANLHLPIHGPAQRIPFCPNTLQNKAERMNDLYNKKLFDRLNLSLGLESIREGSKEPRLAGMPGSLDFSQERAGKRPSLLSTLLHSPVSLKFQEWQSRVQDQGWSKNEAKALLEFSRDKKSIWSSFEQADRERQHKIQDTSKEPTKVTKTKTLFPTTTTHSY